MNEREALYTLYRTGGVCAEEFKLVFNGLCELEKLREQQKEHETALFIREKQIDFLEGAFPVEHTQIMEFVGMGSGGKVAHVHLIPFEKTATQKIKRYLYY